MQSDGLEPLSAAETELHMRGIPDIPLPHAVSRQEMNCSLGQGDFLLKNIGNSSFIHGTSHQAKVLPS